MSMSKFAISNQITINFFTYISNQIGIIDADYRGEIIALVDNFSDLNYNINIGDCLFQLVFPNFKSFNVELVNELQNTERSNNGFGSTGLNV